MPRCFEQTHRDRRRIAPGVFSEAGVEDVERPALGSFLADKDQKAGADRCRPLSRVTPLARAVGVGCALHTIELSRGEGAEQV